MIQEKDIELTFSAPESLISNEYYYKYIFKKTEKIVCAIFYILNVRDEKDEQGIVKDIKTSALDLLAFAAGSLKEESVNASEVARALVFRLVALESQLSVLRAAGVLHADHHEVFLTEIDTVIRAARRYKEESAEPAMRQASVARAHERVLFERKPDTKARARRHESRHESKAGRGDRSMAQGPEAVRESAQRPIKDNAPNGADRQGRIVAILSAEPQSTIKDISDKIKDCSEKTIQRELNTLIQEGKIMREGERRWSRYSVV